MAILLDIHEEHHNKHGEELCGDAVKLHRGAAKTIVVLSDGLGSGVKANILATLTAEILVTMLAEDCPIDEVVATVIGTLPVCRVRELAYASFCVVEVTNETGDFRVVNFDNPATIYLKQTQLCSVQRESRRILEREIRFFGGRLQSGDFLGLLTDGVVHAGLGSTHNFGWGWDNIARYTEESAKFYAGSASQIVRRVMKKTFECYRGNFGDDATFVGMTARAHRRVIIFTGPPLKREDDARIAKRVLDFDGRKIVCGGTTGNIVAARLGLEPLVDISSIRRNVPPIATLDGIDLLTEGILTMTRALDLLKASGVATSRLPADHNGAVLLAREIAMADEVRFIVGQRINEYYQNPDLPPNLSLRKSLVGDYLQVLRAAGKKVEVEYC